VRRRSGTRAGQFALGSAFKQGAEAASTIGCILRALADLSMVAKALRSSSDSRSANAVGTRGRREARVARAKNVVAIAGHEESNDERQRHRAPFQEPLD